MAYKEKEIEKLYYSIGEVAEIFSVAPSLIRFWESEFELIKPKKNRKGNRQFTKEDIDNVRTIYHLVKEKGFTLKGAKVELKTDKHRQHKLVDSENGREHAHHEHAFAPSLSHDPVATIDDDFVDKIAIVNSLQKLRKSLVEIQGQLTQLELQ